MKRDASHFLHCECGAAIPFSVGECGASIACPGCGATRFAPSLSTLSSLSDSRRDDIRPNGFTLQSLFVLTAIWGLICYGLLEPRRTEPAPVEFGAPRDRSWVTGSIAVDHKLDGPTLWFLVRGDYPDAVAGLNLIYELWLQPEDGEPIFVRGDRRALEREFEESESGYNYTQGDHSELRGEVVCVLLDYEIWQGEVGHGELLQKSSVSSKPIKLPDGDEL